MDDQSASSGTDPFGLRRGAISSRVSAISNKRSSLRPPRIDTPAGGAVVTGNTQVLRPASLLEGKPPLRSYKSRLTEETLAISMSRGDGDGDETPPQKQKSAQQVVVDTPQSLGSAISVLTTPTSNDIGDRVSKENQSPTIIRPIHFSESQPPTTTTVLFSQGDDDEETTEQQQHPLRRVSHVSSSSRRQSSLSASASLVSQKMLQQLQSQLRTVQDDLEMMQQEREDAIAHSHTLERSLVEAQQTTDHWKEQCEQWKQERFNNQETFQHTNEQRIELEQWQRNLDSQTRTLQRKQQQFEQQMQEWTDLHKMLEETEVAQQEEAERLEQWYAQLEEQVEEHQNESQRWRSEKQQLQDSYQRKLGELDARQRRLEGMEQRLMEQHESLENARNVILEQERELEEKQARIHDDQTFLHAAAQEMEAKNDSYEAKFALVEQTVEELTAERKTEEQKLEAARRDRLEAVKQAEALARDAESVKVALEQKMTDAKSQYSLLQAKIVEKRNELEEAAHQLQLLTLEERQQRKFWSAKKSQLEDQLDDEVRRLESIKREKERLQEASREQEDKLERLKRAASEAAIELEQNHKRRLEEQEKDLSERRLVSDREVQQTIREAKGEISRRSDSTHKTIEAATNELGVKLQEFESIRAKVDEVVKVYKIKYSQLQKDQEKCRTLREEVDEKIVGLAMAEGREKRLREELEWEVQRLQSLIRSERTDKEERVQALMDEMAQLRARHSDELLAVAKRIELAENERELSKNAFEQMRFNLRQQTDELRTSLDSITKEKKLIEDDLAIVSTELSQARRKIMSLEQDKKLQSKELKVAQDKVARTKAELTAIKEAAVSESREREQVKLLMDRLEAQTSLVDQKRSNLEAEQHRLEAAQAELRKSWSDVQRKEDVLLEEMRKMEELRGFSEQKLAELRKSALRKALSITWRQEKEATSAAFSKWVRVALFDMEIERKEATNDATMRMLQDKELKFGRVIEELENDLRKLSERELALHTRNLELEALIETSKAAEGRTQSELSEARSTLKRLLAEVEALKSREVVVPKAEDRYDQFAERVKEIEHQMAKREAELVQREQFLREATFRFEDANASVRRVAGELQDKEVHLEARGKEVAVQRAKCESAQQRIRELTLQLQSKAEQLSEDQANLMQRVQFCERLETHLSHWQNQLELADPRVTSQPAL